MIQSVQANIKYKNKVSQIPPKHTTELLRALVLQFKALRTLTIILEVEGGIEEI